MTISIPSLPLLLRRMLSLLTAAPDTEQSREHRFRQITSDYGRIISGVCFSYSSSPEDAADLRQDILINIWNGLPRFRGDSGLSTWIYRVALNTAVSTIRRRSRRPATVTLDQAADPSDETIESRERIEWLHARISELSEIDKAVITLWLDDQPYETIAELTGLSRANVAVRINRIKKRLSNQAQKE